ncbi:MAG: phosphatidate cytidylyltransferase [Cellulosilyticaceae bacterium]
MLTRILTAVLGIPAVIFLMYVGNPLLKYAGMVIALIGVYELYHVLEKKYHPIKWIGYISTAVYFVGFDFLSSQFWMFCVLVILAAMITMVFAYPKYHIVDIALTLLGPLYVAFLIGFIIMVRTLPYGEFFVWFIFISAWGSDTCAYFAGLCFGKHKLAPHLSPKKTIEGAVGGALGAVVLSMIYTIIYTQFNLEFLRDQIWLISLIVFIAALISQVGDLAASAIKRMLEEKDYGHIFPGHGGVLDRFDSILFVAPVIAIALTIAEPLINR